MGFLRGAMAAMLLVLAGCSSLPTITPDLAQPRGTQVRLAGSHGAMSAEQNKAILERLQSRGAPTDIFERHLALEK